MIAAQPPVDRDARFGSWAPFVRASAQIGSVLFGRHPWPNAGRAAWLSFALMLLAALAYLLSQIPGGGWGPRGEEFFGNDFVAYLTGARLIASGEAAALYDPRRQLETQRAMMGALGLEARGMEYVNPPLWAAMLVPLLPLGVQAADVLYRIMLLVASAGTLLWLGARGGARQGWRRAALLLLLFFPFVQGWHHRSMVAVLLMAIGGWLALRSRRPFAAGLALSLLLLKPQYAALPFLYLLWKRQRREAAGFALGGVAQAILTIGLLVASGGLPTLDAILPFIGFSGRDSGAVVEAHVNIRAAILHLLPFAPTAVQFGLLVVLTPAAIAMLFRTLGRASNGAPESRYVAWEMLALAAAINLTAPYNHVTGLVLLLPPTVLLLVPRTVPSPGEGRLLAGLVLLLGMPSLGILLGPLSAWLYIAACWVAALGALWLGVAGARMSRAAA